MIFALSSDREDNTKMYTLHAAFLPPFLCISFSLYYIDYNLALAKFLEEKMYYFLLLRQ